MFGPNEEIRGVIPRSVEYLFQCLAKKTAICEVAMVCSFLEVYNDQIRDLGKAYLAAMGVESASNASLHAKTSDLYAKLAGKRGNSYYAPAFKKLGDHTLAEDDFGPGLREVFNEYNLMNYDNSGGQRRQCLCKGSVSGSCDNYGRSDVSHRHRTAGACDTRDQDECELLPFAHRIHNHCATTR